MNRWLAMSLALVFSGTILSGCHKKGTTKPSDQGTLGSSSMDLSLDQAGASGSDQRKAGDEASIRGKQFEDAVGLLPVYFDFDATSLRGDAMETLRGNSSRLKQSPKDLTILVEGHTDERGTTEYNLALAQERATAIRSYYIGLGVDAKRVGTISYGEERPICFESTDSCWARNRRGETRLQKKSVR